MTGYRRDADLSAEASHVSGVLDRLLGEGLISDGEHRTLSVIYSGRVFSLYYELQAALYLGVLAFTTGAGVLVYRNAGSLAHLVNNGVLAAMMLACFRYAGRRRPSFSRGEVERPTPYYDYVLLLGALLFLIVEGYLQNVYGIFGRQWGLAGAIPAALFFMIAYLFDHRGVLSLGIVSAASAVGLEVSMPSWYGTNVFPEEALIYPAMVFSVCLMAAAFVLDHLEIKRHFTFSYLVWSALILLTALLAALFRLDPKPLFFLILAAVSAGLMAYARRTAGYAFFLMGTAALYVGVTYMIGRVADWDPLIWFLYFLASSAGVVVLTIHSVRRSGAG